MKFRAFALWATVVASVAATGCSGFGRQKEALPPISPEGAVLGAAEEKSALTKATDVVVQPATKLTSAVSTAFKRETPEGTDDALTLAKRPKPSAPLFTMLAQMHERSGNLVGAAEQYELALKQDPAHLDALLGMARLHDRQNQFSEAEKYYAEAVRQHPNEAVAHNDYGLCLARQGRLEQAAHSMAAAVKLQPDKHLYRNNMATLLVHMGRPDDALQELIAVHPPAVAHYNVGYLLAQQQQTQLAQKFFAKSVQIDANFAPAQQWVEMLARQPSAPSATSARR